MTRLAVLADIHGALPALEAVIDDMAGFDIDHVVVAGDTVNWGPSSPEVLERTARERWAIIRGNQEYYLLDHDTPRAPEHWRDYVLNPWLQAQLAGAWHRRIAAWPDEVVLRYPDAPPARVMHGWPGDPWDGIFSRTPDAEILGRFAGIQEETIITAHTHLAFDRYVERWHVLNPGSVGVPLDGAPGVASYMILEGSANGWQANIRRVPFDLAPLLEAFDRMGFVEACGPEGRLVIEEFKTGLLKLAPYQNWRHTVHDGTTTTPALVDRFLALDEATLAAYTHPAYRVDASS